MVNFADYRYRFLLLGPSIREYLRDIDPFRTGNSLKSIGVKDEKIPASIVPRIDRVDRNQGRLIKPGNYNTGITVKSEESREQGGVRV